MTGRSVLFAVLLIISLVATGGVGTAVATQDDDRECTTVTHDAYLRNDATIEAFNDTDNATVVDSNVRTKLEKTEAFVRLRAENPNSYCVNLVVQVHPEIVKPAQIGEVHAKDSDTTATWNHMHDFDTDESYTEVEMTLEPDSEVLFAPNRARVLSIAWKDRAQNRGGDLIHSVTSLFDRGDLDKQTYEINSTEGSHVTVPLQHGDRSIDDWVAVYRVGESGKWRPIDTNSESPVFYRESEDGEEVQFIFDEDSDEEIHVEFTANPDSWDKLKHDYRASKTNWGDFFDFNFDLLDVSPSVLEVRPE